MPTILLVIVVALGGLALHDALRRPTMRRLAVRNILRRRGEAALVLVGCILGAAIVTSSFLVGDSLRASIRDAARTQLGPVDELVRMPADRLPAAADALREPVAGAVETLPAMRADGVLMTADAPRRAEPRAQVLELDFDAARRLGADPEATGLAGAGPTPVPGDAVLAEDAAEALGVDAGGRIVVVAGGGRATLRVRAVLPEVGVAGFATGIEETSNVFVAPGTLARLSAGGRATQLPEGLVLVSNGAGVFAGVDRTDAVSAALRERLAPLGAVSVTPVKRDVLETADDAGAAFTSIFAAIGAVAVIAGVLLLINVFVMLAEERKPVLGTLRALGLRRNQMVRAFGIEGGVYAIVGAALGALVGVGVGRIVVEVAAGIFSAADEGFTLRFAVPASSVLTGFAVGASISLATVWLTSLRIARLNVIRAIRDQPSPPWRGSRRRLRALGAVGLAAGGALAAMGVAGEAWFPALVGVPLAALSAVPLLAGVVRARAAATLASLVSLAWALTCFMVLPTTFENAGVSGFVAQGVVATASAIALLTLHSEHWTALSAGLSHRRGGLAARLGLAYPLARPFRTAMQMGMFGLVVFGLVFLAVISNLFSQQDERFVRDIGAGYEMVVDSSPGNPASAALLARQPGVVGVAPLVRALPDFSAARHPEPDQWYLTGFDESLLARGAPALGKRDARYADDRAAFAAVLRSPDLAIVPEWFLQEAGGNAEGVVGLGETVTVHDPVTGAAKDLRAVGVVEGDWAFAGVMVGAPFARDFLGAQATPTRAFVAVAPDADPDAVASALTGRLVDHGVDAESLREVVDRGLGVSRSFMALAQGFVALGLVIGVGGLAVVMVRAVRERRREVGTLRAVGVPHGTVRAAFVLESLFVAARGIVVGGGLSLLSVWLLVTRSDAMGSDMPFSAPWGTLAVMLLATLAAAVAATLVPAGRASHIRPAVALRIAD